MTTDYIRSLRGHGWTYNGVTYPSLKALCKANDANYDRVYYRLRMKWDMDKAIAAEVYSRSPPTPAQSTLNAMLAVWQDTQDGGEHAAIKSITRLGALYLKEFAHV